MEFKIPLKNIKGEIINYSIVDEEDYEKIMTFKWYLSCGYANGSNGRMHRFIMDAKKEDPIIDHINGNKLDNRKENLRFVSSSQNSQNKKKKRNTSSEYIGVCFNKQNKKWECQISINYSKLHFRFDTEIDAAYWYDQLALKYYDKNANINGVEIPNNFIKPEKHKERKLSKGVILSKTTGKYVAQIKSNGKQFYIGTFTTEKEAIDAFNTKKEEFQKQNNDKILSCKITRNKDGIAIIKTSNNEEIFVDDNNYYDLMKYSWHITNGYGQARINNKHVAMHRFLMNAEKNELIDHINNDRKDNRLSNLRKSNSSLNSHNIKKKENTVSKFIGVTLTKSGKYNAKIYKDKKYYGIGSFDTEEEAAKARDKKVIELYGNYAKLNFPII